MKRLLNEYPLTMAYAFLCVWVILIVLILREAH